MFLLAADVRESVFDGYALAKSFAPFWRSRELSQSVLKRLVLGDADVASGRRRSQSAERAEGAAGAGLGIELDDGARLEAFDFTGGAAERSSAHVDLEFGFGEE